MDKKIKPFEELTLKDDYMFKRVMSDKNICKKALELILNIKIKDIKYLEDEKAFKSSYVSKGVRLDVYAEDEAHTVYDIEMQVRNLYEEELAKRMRYYQSIIDIDLLRSGKLYKTLKNSIIIFICPFKILDEKRHFYSFKNFCLENKDIELKDGVTKILLTTKGTLNDVTPEIKSFLEYIENSSKNGNEFVEELDKRVRMLKTQEAERSLYMIYEMKILEEREEGKEIGREEGRKEGRKEGESKSYISSLKSLMSKLKVTIDEAMEIIDVPMDKREIYKMKILQG